MIEVNAPKTACAYDNLRQALRKAFYEAMASGLTVDEIRSAVNPLVAYDALTMDSVDEKPPVFKGIPMVADASIPMDEIHFKARGEVVAVVRNIS